jgi:hypothetical protein
MTQLVGKKERRESMNAIDGSPGFFGFLKVTPLFFKLFGGRF